MPPTLAEAWRATAARARQIGVFFDFDGTVASICDDPQACRPVPGAVPALARLARHVARLAIVSGRPTAFLREAFADVDGIVLYGLYGLEFQEGNGQIVTHPDAVRWKPTIAELAARARRELPAGARVEDKGLTVALHWRTVPQLGPAVEEWGLAWAAELGLRAQPGRMEIDIKPPVDRDKGSTIADAIRGLDLAWYFGDDLNDLAAFAALHDRARADPDFLAVTVAVANPETGAEVARAADFTLEAPEALPSLLDRFAAAAFGD